jgi:hypothetical protein
LNSSDFSSISTSLFRKISESLVTVKSQNEFQLESKTGQSLITARAKIAGDNCDDNFIKEKIKN